jgi:hypothetical protein
MPNDELIIGDIDSLPASKIERAQALQNILVEHATGSVGSEADYSLLRREFMTDPAISAKLPSFVRTCRTLPQFWGFIKQQAGTYRERRQIIWGAFTPLLDSLEGAARAPSDQLVSETLISFDPEGVTTIWQKALARRESDPDGAITVARTLLETVCKRILDDAAITYGETDDLPRLYGMVAEQLTLAPAQHAEAVFKVILGSCQNVVNSLGSLRNKIGDAHGKARPVGVQPRHAQLAVNLAGSMATFLIETWIARTTH